MMHGFSSVDVHTVESRPMTSLFCGSPLLSVYVSSTSTAKTKYFQGKRGYKSARRKMLSIPFFTHSPVAKPSRASLTMVNAEITSVFIKLGE